jgi:cysteinyl-tRNA synthetase
MTIKLYNTLTRKKEDFVPLKKTEVGLYTCGPTVYHYAHIGNLRGFLFYDFLKRVLLFNGFRVKHIMNITDVGHLTSDADVGEDKMLKGAEREKKTVWEVADFYTQAFNQDMKELNMIVPNNLPKATDHIREQIRLIEKLEKKGFTYTAGGNVYFNTSKFKDYGKLARLDLKAKTKSRVEKDPNKKNSHDFVLWFTKSKFKDQEMKWESPWGEGYPGWHLECSAMSMKYLGEQFDIHCGGIDHIPVHHVNEIAQSEAATGKKPWVKYWLHNEFLVLGKGDKMAKSGDNFLTLARIKEKGIPPLAYRYFCLGTSYRNPLMYSEEAIEGAKNSYQKLKDKVLELKKSLNSNKKHEILETLYLDKFTVQINNDLNTPKALATLWEVIKDKKLSSQEKYWLIIKFDDVLGLDLNSIKEDIIPEEVVKLAEDRLIARNTKDWQKADDLRDQIAKLGYIVGDTKEGYELNKV